MSYDIELIETCGACPEQYDAFKNGVKVGYLRLRHGNFTVECPDVGGQCVYSTGNCRGDGAFKDDERGIFLELAKQNIRLWLFLQERKADE